MAWRSLLIFGLASLVLTAAVRSVSAFAIAPGTLDLSGNRGETVSSSVTLVNDQNIDRTYYFNVVKFTAADETGKPAFVPFAQDHSGLPDWIQLPSTSLRVPAASKVDVPFSVSIPHDAASGTYEAALVVSDAPAEVVAGNGASLQANIASLVFLTVEGETVEQAGLLDFSVNPEAGAPTGTFSYRVQNQGNVSLQPSGTVTLTDALGHRISVDANPEKGRALPMTTRAYEGTFGASLVGKGFFARAIAEMQAGMIGPVTATLDVSYGSSGHLTAKRSYQVWPTEMLIVLLGGILLLLIVLVLIRKRFKKK